MAQQFNAIIAQQTDHFRGTSAIEILSTTNALPNFKAITGSAYAVTLSGGQSGSFSVHILGSIGGTTYIVAGLTALTAAGDYMLYPATYLTTGAMDALEAAIAVADVTLDKIVPPSTVVFESGVATAGISTNATVSAVLYSNR